MNDSNHSQGIAESADADTINRLVYDQKNYYRSGATRSIAFRREQLSRLYEAVRRFEAGLMAALKQDLNKPEKESYALEIGLALNEIRFARRHVRRWSKPRRVKTPLTHLGASSRIVPEPLGTSLVIGPWNYPVNLMIMPMVAAIAAGNTVVMKPSEMAPATSAVLTRLIGETFRPEYIASVEGGAEVSERLLKQPFDHIFYTGSSVVGRIVMEAAAKQLIPVTLELGGKSPCIVHKDANLELAAKRIVYGKMSNAGQTCVAPDYLLVHAEVKQQLLERMAATVESFYGSDPIANPDYVRIVNDKNYRRIVGYLGEGRIAFGGQTDDVARKIAPTFLEGVTLQSKVMQEEIFGPVLPVLTYERTEEIYATVQANAKPLALYVFSGNPRFQDEIVGRIPFGGGCVNDTIVHPGNPNLPFGGIGTSGIGSYHGEHGFKAFSHYKGILKQSHRFDLPFRYPDSKRGLALIRKLLR
ncbi:aldehyde dehydrogenase [Cohnella endophytica]|uniref:Aldehyde dehydrogenase n=1 Tax=Cohnella endophytica TaxID=2419778 RepID=A0A494X9M5_9BACL|nr:aldehyde dehydrogenase [Cohnella endophytica]RKP44283.1 aldehyde dehydrogenase [Cohnella endophytica]